MVNYEMFDYRYIAAVGTGSYEVMRGGGVFHGLVLGQTAAGAINIYDSVDGTSTLAGVLKANIVEGDYLFDIVLKNGLTIEPLSTSKFTVAYRK